MRWSTILDAVLKDAGPSTPVEITGLNEVPQAGDRFIVFEDEKNSPSSWGSRVHRDNLLHNVMRNPSVTLDTLFEQMKEGEIKRIEHHSKS